MAAVLNNFCPLPFAHTTVGSKGDFRVCCQHFTPANQVININKDNYATWSNSTYLSEVKKSFLRDERHPGCRMCWESEDQGQPSLRTQSQREYKILGTDQLVNVEVQLGNLCNLKCLMCNETNSSSLLAENIKLGINKHIQQDFQWSDTGFKNLEELVNHKLKLLNIRGGEPLYNKSLLTLIEKLPVEACAKTILHITTNATQFSVQWAKALEKFRLVRIMFSVDATDELYEYMRFPAVWKETESNIDLIIAKKNIKPLVYGVVQNLNVGQIGSLIAWCKYKNLYLQLDQLTFPNYLTITNLPADLKLSAIDHLESVLTQDLEPHICKFITQAHAILTKSLDKPIDPELWSTFQTQINMRDSIRNNSHKRFLKY